jgi:pimeloyl-ACP methyl ester carboxylesterase
MMVNSPVLQLHYESVGTGPDLLFVHGWASSLRMWDVLIAALQDRYRCWSVDLVGHGDSPAANLSADQHTEMLSAFCQQHDIRPQAVIAHSMGGLLTLKLALACPDLFERMVLIAPVVTGRYGMDFSAIVASSNGRALLQSTRPLWRAAQSHVIAPFLPVIQFRNSQAGERQRRDYQRSDLDSMLELLHCAARENLKPQLPSIPQRALLLVGAFDLTVPPAEAHTAAVGLPNARLIEYPNVFHQVLDEQPEETIRQIQAFLNS